MPLEYDIYAFSCVYPELSVIYQEKINDIISYITNPKFQEIADGYGILSDKKRYWALGWEPKVPEMEKEYQTKSLLLKMELHSKFDITIEKEWFLKAFNRLDSFRGSNGLYDYPQNYLTEKNACRILGNHMGMGENRRNRNALLFEGTFRTILILKKLKLIESLDKYI